MWFIRDGAATRGTGCYETDREAAELQLARYIEAKCSAPNPQFAPWASKLKIAIAREENPMQKGKRAAPRANE
jgi:hypothetical protein